MKYIQISLFARLPYPTYSAKYKEFWGILCALYFKDYMTALTCEFNMAFHILATGPQEK